VSALNALQLLALAGLGFTALASTLVSLAVPASLRAAALLSPESRHRLLLACALMPALVALAGVAATVLPSFLGLIWPSFDHCLVHPGEHLHVCLMHLPERVSNLGSWLCVLGAGGFTLLRAGRGAATLRTAARLSSRLCAHAALVPSMNARVLRSMQPLCLLVGVVRPTVVISEGLLRNLTAEQLHAVLLHERAHATRRDTLLRLIARATTLFMWPSARRCLLLALDLAAEQSCDEAAARAMGDRLAMADVLLKVERLLQGTPPGLGALAVSFGGATVPERVTSLLAPRRADSRPVPLLGVLFGALALLFTASAPIHHATETLLTALTR
jgi:Zn-dependent protease with chaperone function